MAMGAGFLLQTVFLAERGRSIGHCPQTNLFEVLIFLCWTITLFYFLIGPSYRLSLMGVFTEPLVFLLQGIALLLPVDIPRTDVIPPSPWMAWHAALCIMAYGAFALAGIAGLMFLAQERQLKTRHLGPAFYEMPSIANLATVNRRLLWMGIALLTAGLASASAIGRPVPPKVVIWGSLLWAGYLFLPLARRWGPRRTALFSASAFVIAVAALCVVGHFTRGAAL